MATRPIDRKGKRYGRLTAIKLGPPLYRESKSRGLVRYVTWICKCECGNHITASASNLAAGITRSCGCLKYLDIAGQKFNKLTVKRLSHIDHDSYWLCLCDCGKSTTVRGSCLTAGRTKSCGCLPSGVPVNPICGICGTKKNKSAVARKNGRFDWRCPKCANRRALKSYHANREKRLTAHRKWNEKNKKLTSELTRRWRKENPERYKHLVNTYKRTRTKEGGDAYLRYLLFYSFPKHLRPALPAIPRSILDAKHALLMTKRIIKEKSK